MNSSLFLILSFHGVETSPLSCGRVIDSGVKAEGEGVFSTDDVGSNCGEVGSSLIDVGE